MTSDDWNQSLSETIKWYLQNRESWLKDLAFRGVQHSPDESIFKVMYRAETDAGLDLIEYRLKALIAQVRQTRHRLLANFRGFDPLSNIVDDHRGRLYAVELYCVLWDGIASQFTNGFLGEDDCPPSDFWVGCTISIRNGKNQLHLVSWIPDEIADRFEDFEYFNDQAGRWIQKSEDELLGIPELLLAHPGLARR